MTAPAPPPPIEARPYEWKDPSRIPRRAWLYGRHLLRKFVSATIAAGGVGKSSLALVDALAMATGRKLLSDDPNGQLRVWYWNLEDPREEIERRLGAICLHYRIKPEDFEGNLFINSGRDTPLSIAELGQNGVTVNGHVLKRLQHEIEEHNIDVLILDPFVATHGVGENDNRTVNLVMQLWAKLADLTDVAIDAVHHVRKGQSGQGEFTVEDGRGASAFLAAVRSARVLNFMTKDEADRFGVENPRRYFRADNGKANLAPPPDKADWYHLVSVPLGNGGIGFTGGTSIEGDHVAVVTPWEPHDHFDDVTVGSLRKAQSLVQAGGPWRESPQAKAWIGYPIAEALGLKAGGNGKLTKREAAKVKHVLNTWIGTGMFEVYEDADETRQKRKWVRVGELATDGERVSL